MQFLFLYHKMTCINRKFFDSFFGTDIIGFALIAGMLIFHIFARSYTNLNAVYA